MVLMHPATDGTQQAKCNSVPVDSEVNSLLHYCKWLLSYTVVSINCHGHVKLMIR